MGTGATERPVLFLSDPYLAMASVIAGNVWRGFPFFAVTLLAGLQTIGADLYDAAKVDGAGIWARFRHVTLPGLAPIMAVEVARRAIPGHVRPSFQELEKACRGGGAAAAAAASS